MNVITISEEKGHYLKVSGRGGHVGGLEGKKGKGEYSH